MKVKDNVEDLIIYFNLIKEKILKDNKPEYEEEEYTVYKKDKVDLTIYKGEDMCSIESTLFEVWFCYGGINVFKGKLQDLKNVIEKSDKCKVCYHEANLIDDNDIEIHLVNKEMVIHCNVEDDFVKVEKRIKIKYCPECGRKL